MFCRSCGRELTGVPDFCLNCGAKPMAETSFCPECGAPTTPLTEICNKCGARVAEVITRRTWKPTAAGFLCIIMGAIGLLSGVLWVLWILVLMGDYSVTGQLSVAVIGYWILGKIAGIVAIVGGIYARRRRIWRLALAGPICTLFCIPTNIYPLFNLMLPALAIVVIPGILATIFVIRGKREFG